MFGYINVVLVFYFEFNCDGVFLELYIGIKVGFSMFCISKEVVYEFVDKVIGELVILIFGQYIYIGGDELYVMVLEDYILFIECVDSIVVKYGKIMVGWDEIFYVNLLFGFVVQYWWYVENVKWGVVKGVSVFFLFVYKVYFDMQYDFIIELGLYWVVYIEVDSVYLWLLEMLVEGFDVIVIFGIELLFWMEMVIIIDEIEYMVFFCLMVYVELGWLSFK